MLRLTQKQYEEVLKTGKISLEARPAETPKNRKSSQRYKGLSEILKERGFSEDEKPKKKSPLAVSIDSIRSSKIEARKGGWVFAVGARPLSPNQLLRIDYRALYGYIKRSHKLAADMSYFLKKTKGKCVVHVHRQGPKFLDEDAIESTFKFLIDGLTRAGCFTDDSREYVTKITPTSSLGPYEVGIKIELLES